MTLSQFLGAKGSFQVEFPDYGVLDFRFGEPRLVFLALDGKEVDLGDHPIISSGPRIDVLISQTQRWAFLGAADRDHLYRWDPATMEMSAPIRLDRTDDDDAAFFHLQMLEHDTAVLIIYENGLICFDDQGRERWRVTHHMYGWQFERLEDSLIWYHSSEGDSWAYRLEDGREFDE
jgi:hypothetical protein